MRSRAYRRHQLQKKKQESLSIYPDDPAAKWANHLKGCSCYMCGNPRKYFNELTMQERKANEE